MKPYTNGLVSFGTCSDLLFNNVLFLAGEGADFLDKGDVSETLVGVTLSYKGSYMDALIAS